MDNLLEYENLVFSIISKYGNYFDKDDLYQVGMIGLIDAYKHFDESVGVKFSSYAYYYILGEVTKFVRENRSVKVSKDFIKLNSSIEKCRDVMRQKLGREPTDTEVSLFLEIEEEKVSEVRNSMQEVKSLDFCYEEDISLYNSVMCFDNETSADVLDLRSEISRLNEEEKALLAFFKDNLGIKRSPLKNLLLYKNDAIILFIRKIFLFIRRHFPKLNRLVDRLEEKGRSKREKVEKGIFWGLFFFVAIPLPGTGAWTGALIAAMLDIKVKKAFPSIAFGVVTAGVIMAVLSYAIPGLFF